MLIRDIINELTLPATRQDAATLLKSAGYQRIGKGHFGRVWAKPGDPWVLKLFSPDDEGYLSFVKLAQKAGNKHFPRFRGLPMQITHDYSAVRVERLQRAPAHFWYIIRACARYLEAINLLDHYHASRSLNAQSMKNKKYSENIEKRFKFSYPSLAEAIDLIQKYVLGLNPNMLNDIDIRNCGVRGADLVFIDPVGWGGSPLHFEEMGESIEPTEEEINKIRQDKLIKQKPKARNMLFTTMPGNDATYPAL